MVERITVLVVCQLAGEALSAVTHLPIRGPVFGMAILFGALIWNGSVPGGMARTADGLLSNLSLLFVPAGTGVMLHFKLLAGDWLPLGAALIVSTLLTITVTAWLMALLNALGIRDWAAQGLALGVGLAWRRHRAGA